MDHKESVSLYLNLFVLMMLSFILRMVLPQLKFIFIPLFLYFSVYVVYQIIRHKHIPGIKHYLFFSGIYLVLLVIYLFALIYKTEFLLPVKEWISGVLLLILLYFLYYFVISENIAFERVKKRFVQHLIVIVAIASFTGILKFIYSASGRSFPLSPELSQNALTSSLTSDYNFFSLAVLYGLITLLYQFYQRKKLGKKEMMGYNLLMLLFSLVILTSQSRRSFVLLLAIIFLILAGRIFTGLYARERVGTFFKRNDGYLVSMAIVCFIVYALIFLTSDQLKRQVIKRSGMYKSDFPIELTNAVNRYAGVLDLGFQQMDLYKRLWHQDAGYQGNMRKEIKQWGDNKWLDTTYIHHNLSNGDFSEGLKSWKKSPGSYVQVMDLSDGNAALVKTFKAAGGLHNRFYIEGRDTLKLSAYVRVVQWDEHLRLQTISRGEEQGEIVRIPKEWEGDGEWHRLELTVSSRTLGNIAFFAGGGSKNKPTVSLWTGFQVHPTGENFDENYAVENLTGLEREKIAEWLKKGKNQEQKQNLQDENRIWQNSLFSRLRSLFSEKNQTPSGEKGPFIKHQRSVQAGDRKMRLEYAFQLFSVYSLTGKLFGNGFSYLSRFGEKFKGSAITYEYPHNPLISALLYSGVIGAGIYLFFLVYTVILYLRHFKALRYFFLLFFVTLMYLTISANSHFSVPAFNFLSLVPWVYFGLKYKTEV